MADAIIKADKELNSDASVKAWHISYDIDDGGTNKNSFVVVVDAADMTDATDSAEAKTLANVKASVIKTAWLSTLSTLTSTQNEVSIEGAVTL